MEMNAQLEAYTKNFYLTDDLRNSVSAFFILNNDPSTLEHTCAVADEAKRLARIYQADEAKVVQAALLHDISNVIPVSKMLETSEQLGIDILVEERRYDRSVHQKLSMVMASQIFGITDSEVLAAIESHTTHKPGAGLVDKILFVSDKISWNLPGQHLYLKEMRNKVNNQELDGAILIYLNQIWDQRDRLKLVHPWLIAAREELLS